MLIQVCSKSYEPQWLYFPEALLVSPTLDTYPFGISVYDQFREAPAQIFLLCEMANLALIPHFSNQKFANMKISSASVLSFFSIVTSLEAMDCSAKRNFDVVSIYGSVQQVGAAALT